MNEEFIYQLRDISLRYNDRFALEIERLDIIPGELFAIVGPSGSGKTTLLKVLDFLQPLDSGEIFFMGNKVNQPATVNIRRRIGMVFQRPELLNASVFENVAFGLRIRDRFNQASVQAVLEQMDIRHLSDTPARMLSGGELQRIAIARVMVSQPDILLLDEPTANLDPYNVELIESLVCRLHDEGTTVVFVTHNIFQAKRIAQRVGLVLNGALVEVSPAIEFFNRPMDPRATAFIRGEMIY